MTGDPKALQFGRKVDGRAYHDRVTVFGVVIRDGKLACVRVHRPAGDYYDLPGGAVDPGETEPQALAREFAEETGLRVRPDQAFAWAAQYMLKSDGRAVNNLSAFWTAEAEGDADPALKTEDDHTLVWLDPEEALRGLRHEAYAWAVLAWMRGARNGPGA
jgi:8-oxo-dGTP diphosphatase